MISRWAHQPSYARRPATAHFNVRDRDDETSGGSERSALASASSTTKKQDPLKFFLVEDNAMIRENLAETLHEIVGAEVVGVSDTQNEATAWLSDPSHAWDVAVIDIFLKRGNGVQVVAALQARPACPASNGQQQIIVLSNYASPEVRSECLRLGADAVFDKSTELDDLIAFCLNANTH